ncbi:MAG: hypothetical protein HY323_07260 [Betaproteobacteria bacterium]|nr:hypothetical protein [Betaproteobacteria bacterium]
MILHRSEGWEARLYAAVARARREPYVIGTHDCALFALDVVRELTGHDLGEAVRGRYDTEAGSLRLMRRLGGGGLREAVNAVLDAEPVGWMEAQRGDVLLLVDARGVEHLGVCLGAEGAVLGPAGLDFLRLERFACAWRIG